MRYDGDTCELVLEAQDEGVTRWLVPGVKRPQKLVGVVEAMEQARNRFAGSGFWRTGTRDELDALTNAFLAKVVPAITHVKATHKISL